MKHAYLLYSIKKLSEGLYSIEHNRWHKQWWGLCKVRKDHVCAITDKPIKKGEQAYRPVTNKGNRYHRITKEFLESK